MARRYSCATSEVIGFKKYTRLAPGVERPAWRDGGSLANRTLASVPSLSV